MDAKVFMSQSFHSSAYHSTPKSEYSGPKIGDRTTVDRWNGTKWVEVVLIWNGSAYIEG